VGVQLGDVGGHGVGGHPGGSEISSRAHDLSRSRVSPGNDPDGFLSVSGDDLLWPT
jgi:hypothetical protein